MRRLGCYISISNEQLKYVITQNKSLKGFILDKKNKVATYSIGEAWDAFRILFCGFDIFGLKHFKGRDLGSDCFITSANELYDLILGLRNVSSQEILEIIHSDEFQKEEFYLNNFWIKNENSKELLYIYQLLKIFFVNSFDKNHNVIFYIEAQT